MSVQTVEVCVHVEMQLQLIYDLNTANTRFTILFLFEAIQVWQICPKLPFLQVEMS
jgi:hypothetical protein